MSLQVWLPLNGKANNQGLLGELPQSTAPSYVDGKLGKSMSTGGFYMTASQTSQVLNNNAISFCFWVYINAETGKTDGRVMFFGNDGMGANNNRKFSLYNFPTVNDLHLSWMNDAASATFTGGVWKGVLPSYQWTHVCVTYQNPNGVIYINGVPKATFSGVSNSATFAYQTQVIYTSSYLKWNDYRIYDHCLSVYEVKEIYKSLVCHYKLSGVGGYNFAKDTYTKLILTSTGGTNENTGNASFSNFGRDPYDLVDSLPNLVSENDYITFSYDWKVITTNSGLTGNFKGGVNASPWEFAGVVNLSDSNRSGRHVYTAKAGSLSTSTATRIRFRMDNIPSGTKIEISNLKFEKSSVPTAWCPAISDALYSSLGYNSNIEYDCSGYGNHGTKSGTITSDSDSPRYNGSYAFNASTTNGDRIASSTGFPIGTFPMFTINFWYKPKIGKTFGRWRDVCGTNCFRLESCNTAGTNYNWFGGFANSGGLSGFNMNTETWYMVTLVSNGSTMYQYLNGNLIASRTLGSDYVSWATNGSFYIGEVDMYFNISDFRIYATALSAEDIKALYNTSASIDKSGTLYAYEFKEE